MKRGIVLALLGALTVVGGCASPAQYVKKDVDSGVVSVPDNSNYWPTYNRREALALIQQHVGPNYEILDERKVVIGQTTQNTQQTNADPRNPNQTTTAGVSTTQNDTQWQITYRRLAGAPVPRSGGAPISTLAPGTMQAQGQLPPGFVPSVQPVQAASSTQPPWNGVQQAGGMQQR